MRTNYYDVPSGRNLSATWNILVGKGKGPLSAIQGKDNVVYIKDRFDESVSISWENAMKILSTRGVKYDGVHNREDIAMLLDDLAVMNIHYEGAKMRAEENRD